MHIRAEIDIPVSRLWMNSHQACTGGYTQSLVHELCIYKGSQSVLYDRTHEWSRMQPIERTALALY